MYSRDLEVCLWNEDAGARALPNSVGQSDPFGQRTREYHIYSG